MVYRAVKEARDKIMGNKMEPYKRMRDYCEQILSSNPGSTTDACKQGFKDGCRPLLHFGGCFLKTYYGAWLLAAVVQDANNRFYVIAYGVVRANTKDAWKWFLINLQENIRDDTNHDWNLYRTNRRCTTVAEFKECMEKLKAVNQGAWEYLSKFEPEIWVKAYFLHGAKVDNFTNNICEVFNAKIVNHRCKLILTMCKEIRCYLIRRMVNHKRVLDNHPGKLAPVQQNRMERLINISTKWMVEWVGDNERKRFEVMNTAGPSLPNVALGPTRVIRSTLVIALLGPTVTQARPPAPTSSRPFKPPGKAPSTAGPVQELPQGPTPSNTQPAAQNQEAPPPTLPSASTSKDSTE
ncbi:uncharacterized protein [Arachis hypogaea]|uniref:uncharacterized protein n=1 Tax=Arachis hypogaea TaxID=3818 RepID=UPI000DECF50E|nr:uncharacterized protein LOC112776512 [Arachis hypogaea]